MRGASNSDRDERESRQLVDEVLIRVPEFRPLYAAHLQDYGELIPALLFGDLTRWIIDLYRRCTHRAVGSDGDCEALVRTLNFLDATYQARHSDAALGLIATCFLENLGQSGEDYAALKEWMHRWPALKGWLDQYG